MPYVMKLKTWKESTSSLGHRRSKELKLVDGAIAQYEDNPTEENRRQILIALEAWKSMQGHPGWESSRRNGSGAVSVLSGQLLFGKELESALAKTLIYELPYGGIERSAQLADLEARDLIRQQRVEAVRRLFSYDGNPRKMKPKIGANLLLGRQMYKQQKKAKAATSAARSAAGAGLRQEAQMLARRIVREVVEEVPNIVPEAINVVIAMVDEIVSELAPEFVTELAAAVVPVFPVVRSGFKFGKHSVSAIRLTVQQIDAHRQEFSFQPGNPEVAAKAITRMIARKAHSEGRMAALYGSDTAARAAAVALDAAAMGGASVAVGAASGAATALGKMSNTLFLVARDCYEMYRANRNMNLIIAKRPNEMQPALDGKLLFESTPLLGAYFVANANTSDLVNFLVSDMGQPGWKFDIEVLVNKHLAKMIDNARGLIAESRFEIEGMEFMKGQTADTMDIRKDTTLQKIIRVDRHAKRMKSSLQGQALAKVRQIGPEKLTRWAESRDDKISRLEAEQNKAAGQEKGRYGGASNADTARWGGKS